MKTPATVLPTSGTTLELSVLQPGGGGYNSSLNVDQVTAIAPVAVCADEAGVSSSREAITMPTASEATMIKNE